MAGKSPGRALKMTPDEVYSFVREHIRETGEPVVDTRDVTDEFDCNLHTARDRLTTLVDCGKLREKKVGQSSVYYLRG